MSISIEQIKELRDATGVSMTACKKALEEADGDYDKSVDILRKKGAAKAADRAARETADGLVLIKTDGSKSAMVELKCETDFVSRGDGFKVLAESLVDKLLSGEITDSDRKIAEVEEAVMKLGENIQISNMTLVEGEIIGDYVHSNGRIAAIVSLEGGSVDLARDIAMHVAATNPSVLSPDEISSDLVEKEKDIWKEQLKQEGKPAEIMDKIMMGKEKKFREANALLKQDFVKNTENTIESLLEAAGASIKSYTRFEI